MLKYTLSLLALVALIGPAAQAQEIELNEPRGYATLSLGLGMQEAESSLGYGANVGILFANNLAGNIFFLSSGNQTDPAEAELSHYGVGGDYELSGALKNIWLGARAGAVTEVLENETQTGFAVGPHMAYVYPVTEEFSLGAEALVMLNSTVQNSSTTYVQATGRYWF